MRSPQPLSSAKMKTTLGRAAGAATAAGSDASDVSSSAVRSVRFFIDDVNGDE